MKKTLAAFLLITTCVEASDLTEKDTKTSTSFKGNWTEKFILIDGKTSVEHFPTKVVLMGMMTSGNKLIMQSKAFNGMPMTSTGLKLQVDSTREEFVQALVDSGLYKK